MTTEITPAYQLEKERIDKLRTFYVVMAIYLVVNLSLLVIDMLTPSGPWKWARKPT